MSSKKHVSDVSDSDTLLPEQHIKDKKFSNKIKSWFKFIYLPFPVFFIVWNEFCERFSYYGMRTILTLFLKQFLNFRDDTATAIYHAFIVMCYLTPVAGAIISDSCLGKYGTIVSLSIVYGIGNVLMSISAIPFNSSRGANIGLTAVSLLVIATGTGGIKPCVAAFGGDQFKKDKIDLLPVFFSMFYFSINAGSMLSTILTPILRSYVSCFGEDTCFPLAFGVPALLMIVSLVIFLFGTRWYLITRPKRDAALLFFRVPYSIMYAIYRRIVVGRMSGVRNFMDYASPAFSEEFVFDVYLFLRVLVMLIPLPVFWALFDQQGSRWTLQALRMDGRFGPFVIEPDQVQVLNPIFIIILIPVFETVVYPLFRRCKLLHRPLQRMVVGMFLAGVAFCIAGVLELHIISNSDRLSGNEARVSIANSLPEPILVKFDDRDIETITKSIRFNVKEPGIKEVTVARVNDTVNTTLSVDISRRNITEMFVTSSVSNGDIYLSWDDEEEFFPDGDKASVTVFVGNVDGTFPGMFDFALCEKKCSNTSDGAFEATDLVSNYLFPNRTELKIGKYNYLLVHNDDRYEGKLPERLASGGIYTIVIGLNSSQGLDVAMAGVNSPNEVSILLQIPMYVVITTGEVLFSITGLEFAYSQAPPSMKSLCQAAWLLTVAFGNLVVVIVAESSIFANQAYEFFFFAGAIIAVTIIFAIMTLFYKYIDPVKLIADQPDSRHDTSDQYNQNGSANGSLAENKRLLQDGESNPMSDIDTDDRVFEERKVKPPDESKL